MEESERIVLANMVIHAERAFDLIGRLGIRAEDFSVASHRAAFAALINKGVAPFEKLMMEVKRCISETNWTNEAVDAFYDLAASPAEVDHACLSFAQGVARSRFQKDTLTLFSDPNLPADMLSSQIDEARAEFDERLGDINRVLGASAPEANGTFDGTLPTPDELLDVPGFINELANFTYSTSHRPNRPTAFAGALAMMAHLAGRKFTDNRGTRPNLYVVALADSGGGKEASRKTNKNLSMELETFTVGNEFASGPGIEDALLKDPAYLFQLDEFDTLLNELKEKSGLSEGMMKYILTFFSESGSFHAMRRKVLTERERELLANGVRQNPGGQVIRFPSLSLYATAVPEHFYGALSLRALTNGLLARTLIFESGFREERGKGPYELPFPASVLQTAQMLSMREKDQNWLLKPTVTVVPDADDVFEAMEAIRAEEDRLYKASERAKDGAGKAVWARGVELAGKLALLYAISENPTMPKVTARGVLWAWKLVQHSARRMLAMVEAYVADDAEDADAQRLKRFIGDYGRKGVMRSVASNRLHLSKKRMDAAESTLLDRREIETASGKGGATIYRLIKRGKK